jgi:hypothetical protein
MEDVLLKRLEWNEPVLPHLKDVRPFPSFLNLRCVYHLKSLLMQLILWYRLSR